MEEEKIIFCKSGGCTAKLGAGVLEHILEKLPKGEKDPNLLVGYDSKDDASVYRLTDDLAMVQTLDFFPPVVEDPYTFGKIAAANVFRVLHTVQFSRFFVVVSLTAHLYYHKQLSLSTTFFILFFATELSLNSLDIIS